MKPAALAVSVCAAVLAKPQPRGVSLQAAWKTTTTKETFGQERNSILCWFILLPLSPLPLNPSCALPFPSSSSPFALYACCALLFHSASPLILPCASSVVYFPPPPPFFFPASTLHLTFSSSLPSIPLVSLLLRRSQAPSPHSISVPGHCCQQLERITANCATCGPLKGRKREEEGTAACQMEVGLVCVRGREAECCSAFWIPPQNTVFNYQ